MSPGTDFSTLGARARGLGGHLPTRAEVVKLAHAGGVPALVSALNRQHLLPRPLGDDATPEAIEAEVRRAAAQHVRTLARWADDGAPLQALWFADEDRRALRALLRGAVQGAPSAARLAGLVPTPLLPNRALEVLARCATPREVTGQLVLLHHPDAPALVPWAAQAQPGLLELELTLLHGLATRGGEAARRGDANLRAYLAAVIDLGNVQTALLLAGDPLDAEPAGFFVAGGAAVALADFEEAVRARTPTAAAAVLSAKLEQGPWAPLAKQGLLPVGTLDRRALAALIAWQRAEGRLEPLGSAPTLRFLLRLRAWRVDLSRVVWGAALGASAAIVEPDLVTPWS